MPQSRLAASAALTVVRVVSRSGRRRTGGRVIDRAYLGSGLIALVVTLSIAAAVSLSPIRWDLKSLGPVLPRLAAENLTPGEDILYVSSGTRSFDRNLVSYGLDLLTFPGGRACRGLVEDRATGDPT